jgi:hypothetical protein
MGNAFAPYDFLRRKRAGKGAWRRCGANDSPVFSEFEYYFIGAIPRLSDPMRAAGKAPPHPSANQPMGEVNASLATVLRLNVKPFDAGADYGPELSACVIESSTVCAACGRIVRR